MAFVLTPEAAAQLQEVIRRVLGQAPSDLGIPFDLNPPLGSNIQIARVTGAAISQDGTDYYPGRLRRFDPTDGWADVTPDDVLWVIDPEGAALDPSGDSVYGVKQLRDAVAVTDPDTDEEITRPLMAVVGGAGDGNCCDSHVGLLNWRCDPGTNIAQTSVECIWYRRGRLEKRDHNGRLIEDCDCCEGGVRIKEYSVSSGTIAETTFCMVVRCGRLVRLDQDCETDGDHCSVTGVVRNTIVCTGTTLSNTTECITLDCGNLKLRNGSGTEIPDEDCSDACLSELSAGPVWTDTDCSCTILTCGSSADLAPVVNFVGTGRGGGGCDGITPVTGTANYVASVGTDPAFIPDGVVEVILTGVPGYVFEFDLNGYHVAVGIYCGDPGASPPRNQWFGVVQIDGVQYGGVGWIHEETQPPLFDPADPGHFTFPIHFHPPGPGIPCSGVIDFEMSSP